MKIKRPLKYIATALVLSLALASPILQAADTSGSQPAATRVQVVFQVSDDDAKKWNLVLTGQSWVIRLWLLV